MKSPKDFVEEKKLKREETEYNPIHQPFFRKEENNFNNQYSSFYFNRLNVLRPIMIDKIKEMDKDKMISKLLELKTGEKSIVIGKKKKKKKKK